MLLRLPSIICLLWALGAGNQARAQAAPQNWEALYDAGVEAEDYADYKKAEALLEQACTLAQAEPDAEPEARACLKLGKTYAVNNRYEEAAATFQGLVDRITERDAPAQSVSALFELADAELAIGRRDSAFDSLARAGATSSYLNATERVRSRARLGAIYLTADEHRRGMDLMYRAQADMLTSASLEDAAAVEAFSESGYALRRNGRTKQAIDLLTPVANAIEGRSGSFLAIPQDLQDGYISLVTQLADSYVSAGKQKKALPYQERVQTWKTLRGKPSQEGVHFVGGQVSPPRLASTVEPNYTEGGLAALASGPVALRLEIWPDGRAHNVRVLHYLPYGLTWRAIHAVRQWKFQPGTRGGEPVRVYATTEISFRLR